MKTGHAIITAGLLALLLAGSALCNEAGTTAGEVIMTRRSIRRFNPERIDRETMLHIVKAGSLAPTAGNLQPWEFIIIDFPETVDRLFPHLRWLGGDPPEDKRPTAYIALLLNTSSNSGIASAGAAAQNMMLAAWEKGIGSCWIGSIRRDKVLPMLVIPDELDLFAIIALGYPDETPRLEKAEESIRPYRDENGILYVPKKPVEDVVHFNKFAGEKTGE